VHYVLLLLILNESPSVESRDGMRDADDIRMHERSRPRLGNYEARIFYRAELVFHVLKGRLRAILRVQFYLLSDKNEEPHHRTSGFLQQRGTFELSECELPPETE